MELQEAIDRGLRKPCDCHIVIVIFGTRMGTPLSAKHRKPDGCRYLSGTEYEFTDAIRAAKKHNGKPNVLVYSCTKAPVVRMDDPERDKKLTQRIGIQSGPTQLKAGYTAPRRWDFTREGLPRWMPWT